MITHKRSKKTKRRSRRMKWSCFAVLNTSEVRNLAVQREHCHIKIPQETTTSLY
jgi:hypothetical protein